MTISRGILGSLALALVLTSGAIALAKDAAAELAKAPAAVRAAAAKVLGDKKLEEFGKEEVNGNLRYEVGWKEGGVDHAAILDPSGKLIQTEVDVELDKVPAAVIEVATKAHPDGKIDEAALATAAGVEFYDIDMKVGKEKRVLMITANGKILGDFVMKAVDDDTKGDKKE